MKKFSFVAIMAIAVATLMSCNGDHFPRAAENGAGFLGGLLRSYRGR